MEILGVIVFGLLTVLWYVIQLISIIFVVVCGTVFVTAIIGIPLALALFGPEALGAILGAIFEET